mmetsp:Transcript_38778/g.104176  ORF Transcript_38778/g.104176 Transcript_38778/m.104176 type:complete len:252 (-) Transcript_38778:175-930(-)
MPARTSVLLLRPLPRGPSARMASVLDAALQVGGQRGVNLLGVRQAELRHELAELRRRERQARVPRLLLRHRGHRPALVVVRGVDLDRTVQGEDLRVHAVVQHRAVALLKVGAPAAAHEQRVSRERLRPVQDVRHAAARVPRRRADLQRVAAEGEDLARLAEHVGLGARRLGDDALDTRQQRLQGTRARDVVGVAVRVEGELEREAQPPDVRRVPFCVLQHRVDDHRLHRGAVGEQVRVRGALELPVEQLQK